MEDCVSVAGAENLELGMKCRYCHGKGTLRGAHSFPFKCPFCLGQKKVKRCPTCKGVGHLKSLVCVTCKGNGALPGKVKGSK